VLDQFYKIIKKKIIFLNNLNSFALKVSGSAYNPSTETSEIKWKLMSNINPMPQ
jgi:hypothetical protein